MTTKMKAINSPVMTLFNYSSLFW